MRVVYDASCKDKVTRISLNDCLYIGPLLIPHIVNILLRFQLWKVALVGTLMSVGRNKLLSMQKNVAAFSCCDKVL